MINNDQTDNIGPNRSACHVCKLLANYIVLDFENVLAAIRSHLDCILNVLRMFRSTEIHNMQSIVWNEFIGFHTGCVIQLTEPQKANNYELTLWPKLI